MAYKMILTACRAVTFLAGVVAFYVALFLHEDLEGKLQNRVEELWIKIDDRARITGNRAAALFNKVASVVTRTFDRILGQKLVSVQMVGVSSSYAFPGLFLTLGFIFKFLLYRLRGLPAQPTNPPANMDSNLSLVTMFCLVVGLALFLIAALPSIVPSGFFRILSILPASIFLVGVVRAARLHLLLRGQLELLAALFVAVLSDIGLFVAVRQSLRWVSAEARPLKICLVILAQIAAVFLFVWLPIEIGAQLKIKYGWETIPQFLFGLGVFNVFTGVASCAFILTLVALLLHRLFWPIIGRAFYQIARYRVVRNHKAMATLGAMCMVFALPSFAWCRRWGARLVSDSVFTRLENALQE
jgi:hypothetical protein